MKVAPVIPATCALEEGAPANDGPASENPLNYENWNRSEFSSYLDHAKAGEPANVDALRINLIFLHPLEDSFTRF
jgi:hypothetical protein